MRAIPSILLLLLCFNPASADDLRKIVGRVVDDKGNPVSGAAIDFFWSANGSLIDAEGKPLDLSSEESHRAVKQRLGQMAPMHLGKSAADGRFSVEIPHGRHALMALDPQRKRGGLGLISKEYNGSSDVEIRLQPLIRVTGTLEGPEPGHRPDESLVIVEAEADPTQPLNMRRLVICDTRDARFLMSLPPGRYSLDAYGGQPSGEVAKEITLTGDTPEVDLGVLRFAPRKPSFMEKVAESQASGALGDYSKRYGKPAPDWHITDAKGISKDAKLADFKGKWVLIHFWGMNCKPCLKEDLPKLIKFDEEHRDQHDQFIILGICIDTEGELKSMADVERAIEPISKHVWGGKTIPFPILLDPSLTSIERFGVPGYDTLLIDPDGKLFEGGEKTLAEKLKK